MSDEKGLVSRLVDGISSASNPIKGALDTAKQLNSMNVDYSVKIKTEELLSKLLDARSSAIELSDLLREAKDKIIELEKDINQKEDFSNDKLNYEMYQPILGTTVYKLKELDHLKQPLHYLCTKCYQSQMKSILQHEGENDVYLFMRCHECNSKYFFPTSKKNKPVYVPSSVSW